MRPAMWAQVLALPDVKPDPYGNPCGFANGAAPAIVMLNVHKLLFARGIAGYKLCIVKAFTNLCSDGVA
jgi:hypothetical protein